MTAWVEWEPSFAVKEAAGKRQKTFLSNKKDPFRTPEDLAVVAENPDKTYLLWLNTSKEATAEPLPWPLQPLPNLWVGVTANDQTQADMQLPPLFEIPAAVRFIALSPMLGPVDLTKSCDVMLTNGDIPTTPTAQGLGNWLHWVICGGGRGPTAKPLSPDWVRDLRDQCHQAGIPFYFQGWGEWAVEYKQNNTVNLETLNDQEQVIKARK